MPGSKIPKSIFSSDSGKDRPRGKKHQNFKVPGQDSVMKDTTGQIVFASMFSAFCNKTQVSVVYFPMTILSVRYLITGILIKSNNKILILQAMQLSQDNTNLTTYMQILFDLDLMAVRPKHH